MILAGDNMNNDASKTTPPRRDNRKVALAQVHIAKKQLAMDDDIYREVLVGVTGKNSCKDMSLSELFLIIKHFEKCGFKSGRQSVRGQKKTFSPTASGQYIDVMRALWINMFKAGMIEDGSEMALTRWAKRQSSQLNGGIGIDGLDWLERDAKLVIKVLESLKQWHKRVLRQWKKADIARVRTYCEALCLNSTDAIRTLLSEHKIMYWFEFEDMGIANTENFCTNRKELANV